MSIIEFAPELTLVQDPVGISTPDESVEQADVWYPLCRYPATVVGTTELPMETDTSMRELEPETTQPPTVYVEVVGPPFYGMVPTAVGVTAGIY